MCLAVPGLVIAIDPTGATVETGGRRRRANTLLMPDLAIGEWVYVSAGTVIEQRLYQLIRQPGPIADRTFEIEFLDGGVEAFAFTFG